MADVILLNQYYSFRKESPDIVLSVLPINLLYLASFLRQNAIDCKICELGIFRPEQAYVDGNRFRCGLKDDDIRDIIRTEKPRIVGIGCMFTRHAPDVMAIARTVKSVDPSIPVVLGGNHATAFPQPVLKNGDVDFVVLGEGEVTFHELCRRILDGGREFHDIPGVAFRDPQGGFVRNKPRPLIEDLDTLPMDYRLVEVPKYAAVSHMSPFLMRYPSLAITTSRGCPNKCIYCTVKEIYGRTWRGRGATKVVDEIQLLHEQYGIREFAFLDDSASVDKKRWGAICEEIIQRRLDIRWTTPNGIAHWTLDKGLLEKMKKAGCYRVTFGIESGNEETRKYLGKPFPLAQAREMIRHANRIGMWTICTNILGFPYETYAAMMDTVEFSKKSGTDFATFYLLVPHVSSEVYGHFKKEGLLDFDRFFSGAPFNDDDYEQMSKIINDGGAPTTLFTVEQLKRIQMRAYRSFVLYRGLTCLVDPLYLWRKVDSWEDLRYMLRLGGIGVMIFLRTFYSRTTKKLLYARMTKD